MPIYTDPLVWGVDVDCHSGAEHQQKSEADYPIGHQFFQYWYENNEN